MIKFAENLRNLRGSKGLTFADLSEKTGITPSGIVFMESQERIPFLEDAVKLADFFNVSLDELIRGEDYVKRSPDKFVNEYFK